MQAKRTLPALLLALAAGAVVFHGLTARAEDKKADPTGTWTWTVPSRGGGPDRTNSLTLKFEGDKLTGKLTAPGRGGGANTETEIEAGKVSGDEISFTVTRTFNDNKIVSKYSGKLDGGTIKGKIEIDRNGDVQTRDWEAKRVAEKAK